MKLECCSETITSQGKNKIKYSIGNSTFELYKVRKLNTSALSGHPTSEINWLRDVSIPSMIAMMKVGVLKSGRVSRPYLYKLKQYVKLPRFGEIYD